MFAMTLQESQQSIFILQDHFTQTKVEGVLLDDYYMHQIEIHHQGNLLTINRQTIEYNGRMLDLLKSGRLIFDDVLVDMEDDTIRVETMNGEHQLITNVKKVVNDFGISMLILKIWKRTLKDMLVCWVTLEKRNYRY